MTYEAPSEVAADAVLFVKALAESIDHEPIAELRIGHSVVLQLLEIANKVHEKEDNDA